MTEKICVSCGDKFQFIDLRRPKPPEEEKLLCVYCERDIQRGVLILEEQPGDADDVPPLG